MKRAYRFRFYPADGQAAELSRTFGRVRLVYNRALDARTTAWYEEQRRVAYADTSAFRWRDGRLTPAKMDRPQHEKRERAINVLTAGRAAAACGDGVGSNRR